MENGEFTAKGFNAFVRSSSKKEKMQFPSADLSREECGTVVEGKIVFFRLQIAHLIFPENFINTVGCMSEPFSNLEVKTGRSELSLNYLFSRMAQVSHDHAVYSTHIGIGEEKGKIRVCDCPDCLRHSKVHNINSHLKAIMLTRKLAKAGIFVPEDDPTDYCFEGDNLVFFEIDQIDIPVTRKYLAKAHIPSRKKEMALKLLGRLEDLYEQKKKGVK